MLDSIKKYLGIACLTATILLVAIMFISIFSSFKPNAVDNGIVFPEDRELFIPVDKGEVLGGDAYAVADRNTGVIYIYTNGALSPLYDKEGNLMIYER